MNKTKLLDIKSKFEEELFISVIPFWEKYSVDNINGGNYNCIDRDGSIYDTTKYMWLQGRLIWMFCKLYNNYEKNERWLSIAESGMKFMEEYALNENERVYFKLTEKGEPIYLQRKIFTECFFAMALAEYGRAINSTEYVDRSKQMLNSILELIENPSKLQRDKLPGDPNLNSLAVPMILLNVIEEVYKDQYLSKTDIVSKCINDVTDHFINGIMYENILSDRTIHNSSEGCLINPGHSIEAGWFLKHWSKILADESLNKLSDEIIRNSLSYGWDNEYGGIFYFLDSRGISPTQLEWDMKLWWPHCEALYATLLIYRDTKLDDDFDNFIKVMEYTFSKFPDKKNGEWFGYLSREGKITHQFKGGPYKGFFHIPRALFYCIQLLNEMELE